MSAEIPDVNGKQCVGLVFTEDSIGNSVFSEMSEMDPNGIINMDSYNHYSNLSEEE